MGQSYKDDHLIWNYITSTNNSEAYKYFENYLKPPSNRTINDSHGESLIIMYNRGPGDLREVVHHIT
ncbi:hypothetical protein QJS04_geneDACA021634 [Acorus gramineus]|uniref:Uncharacterized protein n=1 Tax=Acorus gramineus TaxID=55184 RepID=A0AAV9AB07_ACOGR|nr:hypothetical protein QJS04_geneDACA021634 [Acorus gramineus]